MVTSVRHNYNTSFTEEKYQEYLDELNKAHPHQLDFRIAETPVFCDKAFTDKMLSACESIVDTIVSPEFAQLSAKAIPEGLDIILHKSVSRPVNYVLNNTFGFGGHTASSVFKKYEGDA